MLVPIKWLSDYTNINVDIDEFTEKMIMSGSNIETVESYGLGYENVVVGKIINIEKHKDADKLSVCMVDIGKEETVQIVCGAKNIYEGAFVPVALHKSRIPGPPNGSDSVEGGIKITKGKLRGVESFGMICSASELGFDDKVIPFVHRDGIWLLPEGLELGKAFEEAMELQNDVVDFEITSNRPDCLSMIGMARETAATLGEKLIYPEIKVEEKGQGQVEDSLKVTLKSPEYCTRYTARVIEDVKIQQSPWWLQQRLIYAGMRPINNIVDITNFVMLEYGQPLHAFDMRTIEGNEIVIDKADKGEKFITLDEKERTLTDEMYLIKDKVKGLAIGGVMGGLNSEIKEDTDTIVIESAHFDADKVRIVSKTLGLRTEASSRYEKGVDPNIAMMANDRACQLIEMLGAGKVLKGALDVYPEPVKPWQVDVRVSRLNKLLGIKLSSEEMKKILESLEMNVTGEEVLKVTPPTVRLDLREEVDFIEEIARMYGYDKMENTLPKGNNEASLGANETLRRKARSTMCALGANEIQSYSFVSPGDLDKISIDEDSWERNSVEIKNPLGEENSVMRTLLTPAMLETFARNISRNVESLKAYEIGSVFINDLMDPNKLPLEEESMSIGLYGKDYDFFTLKGMVVELLNSLGIDKIYFEKETDYKVYHPGRCARIIVDGASADTDKMEEYLKQASNKPEGTEEEIELMKNMVSMMMENFKEGPVELGIMGEIHPDVADRYGISQKCYCAELMFTIVSEYAKTKIGYRPLPKYPSTKRDIALLVDDKAQVGDIEACIVKAAGELLEEVNLFDIYRGKQVEDGKKSVAFSLTYRDKNRTLKEEDVAPIHENVLEKLKKKFNAVLRDI